MPLKFYCHIFGRNIWIFHQWTEKTFSLYLKTHYRLTSDLSDTNGITRQVGKEKENRIVIWTRKGSKSGTLVHETLHATNMVLSEAGVKPSFVNDEVQAYYQMALFDFVVDKSKKNQA